MPETGIHRHFLQQNREGQRGMVGPPDPQGLQKHRQQVQEPQRLQESAQAIGALPCKQRHRVTDRCRGPRLAQKTTLEAQ